MRAGIVTCLAMFFAAGCAARPRADFSITNHPIGKPIAGFGACMNPYLYAYPNMPDEISEAQVADLEAKVKALSPQFVRIFFLNSWWEKDTDNSIAKGYSGMRESVIRTIRLAQDAGAKVLLQLWYDPDHYEDADGVTRRFAGAIAELREKHGLTCIRYATIQNEPDENHDDITMAKYVRVYRAFDRALGELGIRKEIAIVGGDLVGENQKPWFDMMAAELSPVLDGYSIHSYWDYWDIRPFIRHIHDTAEIVSKMPPSQRRPVYVTEFGARGFRDKPSIEPGKSDRGGPLADDPVYSFEIGIYLIEAINAGFLGTAQWDMYEAWYDRKMGYGVIGSVESNFKLKPGYGLMQMFTHGIRPGQRAMKIDGKVENVWIAALKGSSPREMAVVVLNRVHGQKTVTVSGLPEGKTWNVARWNSDRTGALKRVEPMTSSADGTISISLSEMEIGLLSSGGLD